MHKIRKERTYFRCRDCKKTFALRASIVCPFCGQGNLNLEQLTVVILQEYGRG